MPNEKEEKVEKKKKSSSIKMAYHAGKLAGKINKLGDALRITGNTTSNAIKKNPAIQSTILSLKELATTGRAEIFEEIKEVNRQADVIIKLLKSRKVIATMMAIDGVPGSGKSTLARALAKKMDFKWKALDYIDMDRPLKFKHVNTIYEHHRLFRTQDIDFFDVLIYIDEPIERSKKRCLHRKRGAINIDFFDYQKLKHVGEKAFEHADGEVHWIENSNLKVKLRPDDGYKHIENIRREVKRKGYKIEGRSKESLLHLSIYGKAKSGLKAYMRLGALTKDLKKGISAGANYFFSSQSDHEKNNEASEKRQG